MRITFPRMGTSYIAIADLLTGLGNEVILPPSNYEADLRLGDSLFAGVCLSALQDPDGYLP